jgi:hypothetical protein
VGATATAMRQVQVTFDCAEPERVARYDEFRLD